METSNEHTYNSKCSDVDEEEMLLDVNVSRDVFASEFVKVKNHSAVMFQNRVYLFGGYTGSKNLNKLIIIDPMTCAWTLEKFEDYKDQDIPDGRNGHAAVLVGSKMYVIGGWVGKGASSQLYVLDLSTLRWKKLQANGVDIGPCNMHTADFHDGKIYVYRGGDGESYLSDMHSLQLSTLTWEKIKVTGELPPPRANHASVVVNGYLYIFGGWDGLKRMNDLHRINLTTFHWEKMKSPTQPPPRAGMKMAYANDQIFMFGGSGQLQTFYNDLWTYSIELDKWAQCRVSTTSQLSATSKTTSTAATENNTQSGEGNVSESQRAKNNNSSKNNPLNPRSGHTMTLTADRNLFIIGGTWGMNYCKNFVIIDIDPQPLMLGAERLANGFTDNRNVQLDSSIQSSQGFYSGISALYNSQRFSDIAFKVKDETIYAHRMMLSLLSDHFLTMLTAGMAESEQCVINMDWMDGEMFKIILRSLYANKLDIDEEQQRDLELLLALLRVCDELLIHKLHEVVQVMIRDLVDKSNVEIVLNEARKSNCSFLISYCKWFVRRTGI